MSDCEEDLGDTGASSALGDGGRADRARGFSERRKQASVMWQIAEEKKVASLVALGSDVFAAARARLAQTWSDETSDSATVRHRWMVDMAKQKQREKHKLQEEQRSAIFEGRLEDLEVVKQRKAQLAEEAAEKERRASAQDADKRSQRMEAKRRKLAEDLQAGPDDFAAVRHSRLSFAQDKDGEDDDEEED